MDLLEQSLRKTFINREEEGTQYDPKIVINQPHKKEYLLNTLQEEIDNCESFFFSVAFLTQSGLNSLKTQLSDLNNRGIKGRLLTSTYLDFNNPDIFISLMKIPNLEVKISDKSGFHSKGYLFEHKAHHSLIIGSSNLTMSALKTNYEWNVLLNSYQQGDMINQIYEHLEEEWEQAQELNQEWLTTFEANYKENTSINSKLPAISEKDADYPDIIQPNSMQLAALESIQLLREQGENKGVVVSATGTGKTFLAALDVKAVKPKKMLFIVHREQILEKAKESFQKIIGGDKTDFGILSGSKKELTAKYLFATIQTISKDGVLQKFAEDYFDYILIDEVHKAGAVSYIKTMDYFKPSFLLGMTATPERTDNFNIFELFDYNIAYEIRLQEALEEDLLCPFHYFGVVDYEKDEEVITDNSDLQSLIAEERVKYLLEKIDYYGCSGNNAKGLVFCSRKEEALKLSVLFSERGIPSTYLTGDHSIEKREQEVKRLEDGAVNYIFTVDIFNEGIDIPKVNQIIMLRSTQSSIIFIQQLGRGLRKDESKEFVTIIDFIGNYQNNYMIPMALSGDTSRSKNNLRQDTYETNYISGVSAVNFEKIAKERIFASIDSVKLDSMVELRKAYSQLKNRLNRVPYLIDFQNNNNIDPLVIANKSGSYYDFLVKLKDTEASISESENKFLVFFTREVLPGMRRHEIVLLEELLATNANFSFAELVTLFRTHQLANDDATVNSVIRTLTLDFFVASDRKTYTGAEVISKKGETLMQTDSFKLAKQNPYFVILLKDILLTAAEKSREYDERNPLTLYQQYTRKEAMRFLNWHEQMVNLNIGGYVYKDGKFAIFVTLDKGDDFKGAQMAYEDELIDVKTMHWLTKSPRTLDSPEVKILQNHDEWEFHLFVQKSDDEGADLYYLGEVTPNNETIQEVEKVTRDGVHKKVVEMSLILKEPIDYQLYKYLTLSLNNSYF